MEQVILFTLAEVGVTLELLYLQVFCALKTGNDFYST